MTCQKVMATRESLVKRLEAMGFVVLPSGGNFIFAKHPDFDGADLAARLREKNIVIRHFKQPERISPYLRITIGTDLQMQALVDVISAIIQER